MEHITFTIADIGYGVLYLIFLGLVAFAIVVLTKVNALLGSVNLLLKENENHLNQMIPNLARISENALAITNEMKKAGKTLEQITSATKDTVMRFNETADRIGAYAVVIGEVAKVLIEVFSGEHKK